MQRTIQTTDAQEAGLTSVVTKINEARASEPDYVPITEADYLQSRVSEILDSYVEQGRAGRLKKIEEAVKQDPTVLDTIEEAIRPKDVGPTALEEPGMVRRMWNTLFS